MTTFKEYLTSQYEEEPDLEIEDYVTYRIDGIFPYEFKGRLRLIDEAENKKKWDEWRNAPSD